MRSITWKTFFSTVTAMASWLLSQPLPSMSGSLHPASGKRLSSHHLSIRSAKDLRDKDFALSAGGCVIMLPASRGC